MNLYTQLYRAVADNNRCTVAIIKITYVIPIKVADLKVMDRQ